MKIKELLKEGADATACPDPYDIDGDGKADGVCEGGRHHSGFYGAGVVNALRAVR